MAVFQEKIIFVQYREVCTKNIDEVIDVTYIFIRDKFDTCLLNKVTTKITLNSMQFIIYRDSESTCGKISCV